MAFSKLLQERPGIAPAFFLAFFCQRLVIQGVLSGFEANYFVTQCGQRP